LGGISIRCSVCRRPDRADIDARLVAGESERSVGAIFKIPKSSIHAHRAKCVAGALSEAIARERAEVGDRLLAQLDFLLSKSLDVISRSEAKRNDALLLKGIAQSLDVLRLRADLSVKPQPPNRVTYNVSFINGRPVTTTIDAPALPEAGAENA